METEIKKTRASKQSAEPSVEDYKKEIDELKQLIQTLMQNQQTNQQPVYQTSSVMDRPCTIIHLWECVPGLPTTIYVKGRPYTFEKFGEKRIFRFEDMQEITWKYRDFFNRGVFTLGADCDEMQDDFGVEIMKIPMSKEKYKKIASLPEDEFETIVKNLNMSQKILLAKTWTQRYEQGLPGYNNFEKIAFLNSETGGFLKPVIEKLTS